MTEKQESSIGVLGRVQSAHTRFCGSCRMFWIISSAAALPLRVGAVLDTHVCVLLEAGFSFSFSFSESALTASTCTCKSA